MDKKLLLITSVLILLSVSFAGSLPFNSTSRALSNVIRVPANYQTIQAAINAANPGDSIIVAPGVYYEHVIVNKTLSLIGETKETTIIDGSRTSIVVRISADNVNLSEFTIRHSGQRPWTDSGVFFTFGSVNCIVNNSIVMGNYHGVFFESSTGNTLSSSNVSSNSGRGIILESSSRNTISANFVSQNEQDNGIDLFDSTNNEITRNTVSANGWAGIYLVASPSNIITENTVSNNSVVGIHLEESSNNVLYRNNLLHNGLNDEGQLNNSTSTNTWDNDAEGNYWSDYVGQDLNGDGIGDTNIPHLGVDSHPLIEPWSSLRKFFLDGSMITVLSDSTIASFSFNASLALINLNSTGPSNTLGFCNITIPKNLLRSEPPTKIWTVTVNGTYASFALIENFTHTSLYFTYAHSTRRVQIRVVQLPNVPPTADFTYSLTNPTPYDTINFTDTSSDPDGSITSWQWEFGDDNNSTEQNPRHKYANAGTYIVTLRVKDNLGTETVTSKALLVRKVKTTLKATAPSTVNQGQLFSITATLQDENNDPMLNAVVEVYVLKEKWETIGSSKTNASGVTSITYKALLEAGTYQFKAQYNGTQNLVESISYFAIQIIEVPDTQSPTADAGADRTTYVDVMVIFDASESSDNVGIVDYDWDFGDGTTGTGIETNHTYTSPGEYTVALTVEDVAGNTALDSITVTVLSSESFPIWAIVLALIAIAAIVVSIILWKKRKRV